MARASITEAAARLGVSVDSIRRRLRKGELPGVRDNRGQWWLDLPNDMLPSSATPSVDERLASTMLAPAQQPMQLPDTALMDALRDRVANVTERLHQAEAQARQAGVERDQARQEREAARVQAATAEGEVKGLREALAEARRPAWRRWLGLP